MIDRFKEITSESDFDGAKRHWHIPVFPCGEFEVGLRLRKAQTRSVEETRRLNQRLESTLAEKEQSGLMNEMAHLLQAARVIPRSTTSPHVMRRDCFWQFGNLVS